MKCNRERVTRLEIIGTIVSFAGALVIVNDGDSGSSEDSVIDLSASITLL